MNHRRPFTEIAFAMPFMPLIDRAIESRQTLVSPGERKGPSRVVTSRVVASSCRLRKLFAAVLVGVLLLSSPLSWQAWGLDSKQQARLVDVKQTFFDRYCVQCHAATAPEAEIDLSQVEQWPGENLAAWQRLQSVLVHGEMPPPEADQPSDEERQAMRVQLNRQIIALSPATTALRRLNRFEYENTVRDLLGIDAPLQELLPEDNSVQGFDNVSDGLGISAVLMERYLEAANVAFEHTIRRIRPLPPETRRSTLIEQKDNIASVEKNKGGVIESEGAFVDFTPGWPPARNDPARPIEDGIYRCRIAVWPHDPGPDRTIAVAVFVGPLFGDGKRRFMGMFDATGSPDDPRIIEFTTRMEELDALHILPWIYPEHVTWRDKEEPRPGLAIAWAETHGPLDQEFPSPATRRLFGTRDSIQIAEGDPVYIRHRRGAKTHFVTSSQPRKDATRIIHEFAQHAFRRPVGEETIAPFVELTLARLDAGNTFEQAIQAGVSAVLCSPYFLLINYEQDFDDYTLANRLSYFLWSSMPDEELLELAAQAKLSDSSTLHAQVERMLNDPKSERFIEHFTDQWLDLDELEFTTPDKKLYPEYDELLLRSMRAETRRFFAHLLREDLSLLNFVDSDFAFLNQRLASHYGIPGVRGHEQLKRVQLPANSVRGGLFGQASIMKVTANGTTTSPILRGAWVLDKLLGEPAPPPPAGVPAVEPDIRGATTIREQLERHRADESCARCHRRIDPPGFALEEFDVIGGHRQWYRSLGSQGERVPKTRYRMGPAVDSSGALPDGRTFANYREFRNYLQSDPDRLARGFAKKLLTYASGRPFTAADEESVEQVITSAQTQDYGLRSMIHAVVESEMFHRP